VLAAVCRRASASGLANRTRSGPYRVLRLTDLTVCRGRTFVAMSSAAFELLRAVNPCSTRLGWPSRTGWPDAVAGSAIESAAWRSGQSAKRPQWIGRGGLDSGVAGGRWSRWSNRPTLGPPPCLWCRGARRLLFRSGGLSACPNGVHTLLSALVCATSDCQAEDQRRRDRPRIASLMTTWNPSSSHRATWSATTA